jgi:hypothetical protein
LGVLAELETAGLVTLADKGYHEHVREDPVPGEEQARIPKEANRAHARRRAPGERANAQLKTGEFSGSSAAALARRQPRQGIHVLQTREA